MRCVCFVCVRGRGGGGPGPAEGGHHHLVPRGLGPDGVLGSQRSTAEQDEEQDEVGEPSGIDDAVTQDTDPGGAERGTEDL